MAVIAAGHISKVWDSGDPGIPADVYVVTNVTAGDTADLSTWFSVLLRATYLGLTDTTASSASVSGTVVTIPAGPAGATGLLTVFGEAASVS